MRFEPFVAELHGEREETNTASITEQTGGTLP